MSIPPVSENDSSSNKTSGPLVVGAAIIIDRDRYLISQRLASAKVGPGLWEFPGGKVEAGEDPRSTVKREIREELGIEVEVGDLFEVASHVYLKDRLHIILIAYICRLRSPEPALPLGVADIRWVTREQLNTYDFAEADQPLIERLKKLK